MSSSRLLYGIVQIAPFSLVENEHFSVVHVLRHCADDKTLTLKDDPINEDVPDNQDEPKK